MHLGSKALNNHAVVSDQPATKHSNPPHYLTDEDSDISATWGRASLPLWGVTHAAPSPLQKGRDEFAGWWLFPGVQQKGKGQLTQPTSFSRAPKIICWCICRRWGKRWHIVPSVHPKIFPTQFLAESFTAGPKHAVLFLHIEGKRITRTWIWKAEGK